MNRHQERLYRMLEKEIEEQVRILELNPHHPLIRNLAARLAAGRQDDLLRRSVRLLYRVPCWPTGCNSQAVIDGRGRFHR
jgi:HSP90 family molecular chaperone